MRLIDKEEARRLYGGIHADANLEDVPEILINESSGWAEASTSLTKTIETIVAVDVEYIVGDIEKVLFDNGGSSTGVRIKNRDVCSVTNIILATGAMTAKILADSAPQRREIHVDG